MSLMHLGELEEWKGYLLVALLPRPGGVHPIRTRLHHAHRYRWLRSFEPHERYQVSFSRISNSPQRHSVKIERDRRAGRDHTRVAEEQRRTTAIVARALKAVCHYRWPR